MASARRRAGGCHAARDQWQSMLLQVVQETQDRLKAAKPYLCWRRQDGRECAICPAMQAQDPEYSHMKKPSLEEKLRDPQEQNRYNQKVAAYESEKNSRGGARCAQSPSGKQSIAGRSTCMVESRTFVGFLWQKAYWQGVKGIPAPRRRLASTMHQGKQILGVYENTPGPDPLQALDVWSVD